MGLPGRECGMKIFPHVVFVGVFTFSFVVQGTTGFGGAVLSLPLLAFFFPLKELIPTVIAVNVLQSGWIVVRDRRHLARKHGAMMAFFSLLGLPLGFLIYRYLPGEELKIALGGFVVAVALWNLAGGKLRRPLPTSAYYPLLFLGGISEGALAAGGPFIVIYAARMIPDKTAFRVTVSLLWIILNTVMVGLYTATRVWHRGMVPLMLLLAPCILLGTWLGIHFHDRIPQKPFRKLVFTILLLSGIVLLRPLL